MSARALFKNHHGANITLNLERNVATWKLTRSDAVVLADDFLRPNDKVSICVEGSGRVEVGITEETPDNIQGEFPRTPGDVPGFRSMNEIRFHKRSCSLTLFFNSEGTKVISNCKPVLYQRRVRTKIVWVVLCVKFGRATVQLIRNCDTVMQFYPRHGTNVRLSADRTNCYSINPNPDAVCVLDTPLKVGDTAVLKCTPLSDNSKVASNFSIKLMACADQPLPCANAQVSEVSSADLFAIQTLTKLDCNGIIKVALTSGKTVEYLNARNFHTFEHLPFDGSTGIKLYLELYRMSVEIVKLDNSDGQPSQSNCLDEFTVPEREMSPRKAGSAYLDVVCTGTMKRPVLRHLSEQRSRSSSTCPNYFREYRRSSVDNDYYCQVTPRRHSLSSLTYGSCPTDLDKLVDEVDGQRILGKISDIEVKVESLGLQLASLPTSGASATNLEEPEDMVNIRDNIRRNYVELLYCLQADAMCDHLYQYEIITCMESEKIHQAFKVDRQSSNRLLLDILSKKKISKSILTKVLDDIGDHYLIELLFT